VKPISIAHGIVATPERFPLAADLASQLDADVISVDDDHMGERANHQNCLEQLMDVEADWLVMIEDDAILCQGFVSREFQAVREIGRDHVGSWYLGTGRWAGKSWSVHGPRVDQMVANAERTGADLIWADGLWHAVAVAIPSTIAPELLHHMKHSEEHTDWAISDWCKATGTKVAYTIPSLVDHRDDRKHMCDGEPVDRHAICFEGV
jgi:hypothetical protein